MVEQEMLSIQADIAQQLDALTGHLAYPSPARPHLTVAREQMRLAYLATDRETKSAHVKASGVALNAASDAINQAIAMIKAREQQETT